MYWLLLNILFSYTKNCLITFSACLTHCAYDQFSLWWVVSGHIPSQYFLYDVNAVQIEKSRLAWAPYGSPSLTISRAHIRARTCILLHTYLHIVANVHNCIITLLDVEWKSRWGCWSASVVTLIAHCSCCRRRWDRVASLSLWASVIVYIVRRILVGVRIVRAVSI